MKLGQNSWRAAEAYLVSHQGHRRIQIAVKQVTKVLVPHRQLEAWFIIASFFRLDPGALSIECILTRANEYFAPTMAQVNSEINIVSVGDGKGAVNFLQWGIII